MSVYLNGILYFQLFRQTGKQEFRHGSVLWNKGREVCLSLSLIHISEPTRP